MSKIKVGIFGDSYANSDHGHTDFPELKYNAWFYNLESKYEAVSYGVAGASNYYSYTEFLANHSKYDKNIFLLTYPGRHPSSEIYIDRDSKFDFLGKGQGVDFGDKKRLFPSSANTADYLISHAENYNLDHDTLQKLKAIRSYYLFLENKEFDLKITNFLIQDVLKIRPDTIFINLFYERFYHEPKDLWGLPLITSIKGPTFLEFNDAMIRGISLEKSKKLEFPHQLVSGHFEIRCTCHFSKEVNLVIAESINESLDKGKWEPIVPNLISHTIQDLEYYYDLKNPFKSKSPGF